MFYDISYFICALNHFKLNVYRQLDFQKWSWHDILTELCQYLYRSCNHSHSTAVLMCTLKVCIQVNLSYGVLLVNRGQFVKDDNKDNGIRFWIQSFCSSPPAEDLVRVREWGEPEGLISLAVSAHWPLSPGFRVHIEYNLCTGFSSSGQIKKLHQSASTFVSS